MKRVKRTLCVVIAGLLVMSLVARASYEDTSIQQLPDEFLHPASVAYGPTGDRQVSDYQFGFLWGGKSDYYEAMPMLFARACGELNIPMPIDATPKNWDQQEQNAKIDKLLEENVKGICMMPSEEVLGNYKISKLVADGIPVVCIGGAPAQPSQCTVTLATDVYQCAYDATLTVLDALNYEGNIVAITGAASDTNSAKRLQGVADACAQYSKVTLLDRIVGATGESSAPDLVKQLLQELGVSTWAVIHCPEVGIGLDENDQLVEVPSLKLPDGWIAGTVGAGNAFCAGVLYGAWKEIGLKAAIEKGTACAACSLSQPGGTEGVRSAEETMQFYRDMR